MRVEGESVQERAEFCARAVLQCSLPNRQVKWLRDKNELDLRISFHDKVIGYAEVTINHDKDEENFKARLQKFGYKHDLPGDFGIWTIVANKHFETKINPNFITQLISRMIENSQWDSDWLFGPHLSDLKKQIESFGIESLRKSSYISNLNHCYIFGPTEGGLVDIDSGKIDLWISEFLSSEHFQKKLNQITGSTSAEKHLVLFMGSATPWVLRLNFRDNFQGIADTPKASLLELPFLDYLWIIHPSLSSWWLWSKPDSKWHIYEIDQEFDDSGSYLPIRSFP